jgi:xylulokinase
MYLGIDLGTSSVKVVLIDEHQNLIAESSCNLSVSNPRPLWSEQDPKAWWKACQVAISNLKNGHSKDFKSIKGIGLSGQMHGAVVLDEKDLPLRPAILWNDGRSEAECREIEKAAPSFESITGNQIMPGFTAPKLLWIERHEPEIFKKIKKILLPKDYIRLMLTGDYATEMSDASGTMWLDVPKREWSPQMLDASHVSIKQMPKLYEGSDITGTVRPEIAISWGIPSDCVVVGGGGDNAASALGLNVVKKGDAFLSIGSSGVYFVVTDACRPAAKGGVHTMCHCLPNLWHQMTVHLSASSALDWWKKAAQVASVKDLLDECEKEKSITDDLFFLPYLSGERSPHNDPYAKGVFFGMTHKTMRANLTQAVLEGVAFNFAEGQRAMLNAKSPILHVQAVGGGSKSPYWGKVLASSLGRNLIYRKNREVGAALGAAKLAFLGTNPGALDQIQPCGAVERTLEPEPELMQLYKRKQKIYRMLYDNLKGTFYEAFTSLNS